MTSELRALVSLPKLCAFSRINTSWPRCESSRAIARPTTPAPMMAVSTCSKVTAFCRMSQTIEEVCQGCAKYDRATDQSCAWRNFSKHREHPDRRKRGIENAQQAGLRSGDKADSPEDQQVADGELDDSHGREHHDIFTGDRGEIGKGAPATEEQKDVKHMSGRISVVPARRMTRMIDE